MNETLSDNQKIEIARSFVESHTKTPDLNNWQPFTIFDENKKLLHIFYNIIGNEYGECRALNVEIDENGDILKESTEYEIEISKSSRKDNIPYIFWFDITKER